MARSHLTQAVQIGVETTPGTAVPANVKPTAYRLSLTPAQETQARRAAGDPWASRIDVTRESSELTLEEGQPDYVQSQHLLAASIGNEDTVDLEEGITYSHTFPIRVGQAAERATLTVEVGDSDYATKAAHAVLAEIGFSWNRTSGAFELTGSGFAGRHSEGNTRTASPTLLASEPILASHVSVYVAAERDDLDEAGSKIGDLASIELKLSDLVAAQYALDAAAASYTSTVDGVPSGEVTAMVPHGAGSTAWLTRLRSGEVTYLRIEAVGRTIPGQVTGTDAYRLTIDLAVATEGTGGIVEHEKAACTEVTLQPAVDASGFAGEVTLVNDQPHVTA